MKRTDNKGFSLIELVIVIAIMAVLVGIMAPQLMRYVERSKVAADLDLMEGLNHAIVMAASDPSVQEEASSLAVINSLVNKTALENIPSGNRFYNEILKTMSWPDLSQATYQSHLSSYHASDTQIFMQFKGGILNPMAIWISKSDVTGNKNPSPDDVSTWVDLDDSSCHLICVK
ncbi:MAG: type II secretion system protein [Lachnospiraceae bacterium]|nr:type II secretion system protein [Lachnospiraceae bacterium]